MRKVWSTGSPKASWCQHVGDGATLPTRAWELRVRRCRVESGNQRTIELEGSLGAVVFYVILPPASHVIKAKTVLLRIVDVEEAEPEPRPLFRIHDTLEDRILDTLPKAPVTPAAARGWPRPGSCARAGGRASR